MANRDDRNLTNPPASGGAVGGRNDWSTERQWWQQNYRSRPYATDDRGFDFYEPGFRYGSDAADRYRGRDWSDVEGDLRSGWDRYEHRGASRSTWEEIKDSVKDAWDHVTGGGHDSHTRDASGTRRTS